MQAVIGEDLGGFQCFVKAFSLSAYGKDLLEDRLAFGRLGITLQDGHALHGRNACLKQHGSLTAKRSDLFIRK